MNSFAQLDERILSRSSQNPRVARPPLEIDALALVNRGRQVQLRQVSATYIAMEFMMRNFSRSRYNHAAVIFSDPDLTKAFINLVETNKLPADMPFESFAARYTKLAARIAVESYSKEGATDSEGRLKTGKQLENFANSRKSTNIYLSEEKYNYGKTLEDLERFKINE